MTELMPVGEVDTYALPVPGEAALLHQVFTAPQAAAIVSDLTSSKQRDAIPWGRHTPGKLSESIEKLRSAELYTAASCFEYLGELASRQLRAPFTEFIAIYAFSQGLGAHRDGTVGSPMSFIVVLEQEVLYRLGGRARGRKHVGRFTEHIATPGDVLAINNRTTIRKRAVHSSVAAGGRRLVLDYYSRNDL